MSDTTQGSTIGKGVGCRRGIGVGSVRDGMAVDGSGNGLVWRRAMPPSMNNIGVECDPRSRWRQGLRWTQAGMAG